MYNEQNNRFTNQMHGEYEDRAATIAKAAAEANKAIPGFDATNYGQEDYVLGNSGQYACTGTVSCWRFLNPY